MLALGLAGFSSLNLVTLVGFEILRNAGWSLWLAGLEYLDFLPGIEDLDGEEGVPVDLNTVLFVFVVVEVSES